MSRKPKRGEVLTDAHGIDWTVESVYTHVGSTLLGSVWLLAPNGMRRHVEARQYYREFLTPRREVSDERIRDPQGITGAVDAAPEDRGHTGDAPVSPGPDRADAHVESLELRASEDRG